MILMGSSETSCSALSHAMIQRRFCVVSHHIHQVPEQLWSSQARRLFCLSMVPLLTFHSPADLSVVPVVLRFACTLLAEPLFPFNGDTPYSPHNHFYSRHISRWFFSLWTFVITPDLAIIVARNIILPAECDNKFWLKRYPSTTWGLQNNWGVLQKAI